MSHALVAPVSCRAGADQPRCRLHRVHPPRIHLVRPHAAARPRGLCAARPQPVRGPVLSHRRGKRAHLGGPGPGPAEVTIHERPDHGDENILSGLARIRERSGLTPMARAAAAHDRASPEPPTPPVRAAAARHPHARPLRHHAACASPPSKSPSHLCCNLSR